MNILAAAAAVASPVPGSETGPDIRIPYTDSNLMSDSCALMGKCLSATLADKGTVFVGNTVVQTTAH